MGRKKQRGSPQPQHVEETRRKRPNSLDLSFPLRGIRQIRDRSENRMRFSERSSNLDVRHVFFALRVFFSEIFPRNQRFRGKNVP